MRHRCTIIAVVAILLAAVGVSSTAARCIYTATTDSVVTLQQVLVEAKAYPICLRGDTLVYAVPAFIAQEGERLRALMKDVPGIEVLSDGTIKARGRLIDRLLLNGRELFGMGVTTLIDNLPAAYLQSIVIYNDASRHDKETGIIEGMGEQVMDLVTTEENRSAWLSDASAGGGTKHRFALNASAGKYSDQGQHMFSATFDNLPGTFGIGESYYDKLQKTAGTADSRHHNLNASMSWFRGQWDIKASAFYDGARKTDITESEFSAFLSDHTNTSRQLNDAVSRDNTISAQASLTWTDTLWTVHIDPLVTWSKNRQNSDFSHITFTDRQEVNRDRGFGQSLDDVLSATVLLSVNRKLGSNGRNIDLRWHGNVQRGTTETLYGDDIWFAQSREQRRTQRSSDGSDNRSESALTISYTQPIIKTLRLKAEYGFGVSLKEAEHPVLLNTNDGGWLYSDSLSRSANSRNVQQQARLSLQYTRGRMRTVAGMMMESNRTQTTSNRYHFSVDTLRSTIDWNPELGIYLNVRDGTTLSATYGGRSHQPSIIDMLPNEDSSDPLNVRRGNPGLRSSFTHQLRVSFFHFQQQSQLQFNCAAGFDWEQHAVTDRVLFDAVRGVRYYLPTNVDGNRTFVANWGLQTGIIDSEMLWLDLQGDYSLHRLMGYQTVDYGDDTAQLSELLYSTTQSQLMQYVALQLQVNNLSVKPYGYFRYNHLSSTLVGALVRDTYIYGYGGLVKYEHPSGFSASVDVYEHQRRGYHELSLNTDQLIVDLELAYAFLKSRSAEVRLMACDLLGNRDLVESVFSQTGRIETRGRSAVNSYWMATLTYRF